LAKNDLPKGTGVIVGVYAARQRLLAGLPALQHPKISSPVYTEETQLSQPPNYLHNPTLAIPSSGIIIGWPALDFTSHPIHMPLANPPNEN